MKSVCKFNLSRLKQRSGGNLAEIGKRITYMSLINYPLSELGKNTIGRKLPE